MKKILFIGLAFVFLLGCSTAGNISSSNTADTPQKSDTVRIANDDMEYEVIIIDPGFNGWLAATARPRGYYSETFLENRNQLYVQEWNIRATQPLRYNNLYEMPINYDSSIHYGYEVNYLMYNYFIYFQLKHRQKLAGFVPRP